MGPISAAGRISILEVTRVGSPCNHPAQAQYFSLTKLHAAWDTTGRCSLAWKSAAAGNSCHVQQGGMHAAVAPSGGLSSRHVPAVE